LLLTNPEKRAALEAMREELLEKMAGLATARSKCDEVRTNLETLRKAGAASENEATGVRARLRDLIRETLGRPSKKLHDLTAEQRSALIVAEEYQDLAKECEANLARAELDLQPHLSAIAEQRRVLISRYADALIAEAVEDCASKLALGMQLQRKSIREDQFDPRHQLFETPDAAVLAAVKALISPLLATEPPADDELVSTINASAFAGRETLSPRQVMAARARLAA